jgi:flagellar biosynthesis protein FlhB
MNTLGQLRRLTKYEAMHITIMFLLSLCLIVLAVAGMMTHIGTVIAAFFGGMIFTAALNDLAICRLNIKRND